MVFELPPPPNWLMYYFHLKLIKVSSDQNLIDPQLKLCLWKHLLKCFRNKFVDRIDFIVSLNLDEVDSPIIGNSYSSSVISTSSQANTNRIQWKIYHDPTLDQLKDTICRIQWRNTFGSDQRFIK